jgi:glycine/D-amino acid oxidase-like deaminating enzyme
MIGGDAAEPDRGAVRVAISQQPLPPSAEIVIIGAGVMGLSIAYQLARRGLTDVVVIDRGYLAEGASGRNGGGIRQQWSTAMNVRLMQRSVALCKEFATELGVNVWFRQGGYLFLARTEREMRRLEKNVVLQNACNTTPATASCFPGPSCGATPGALPSSACESTPTRR